MLRLHENSRYGSLKKVQQIKVERGILFPDARKASRSEQSTNTSSKRTAASVVSGSTTVSSQRSQWFQQLSKLN